MPRGHLHFFLTTPPPRLPISRSTSARIDRKPSSQLGCGTGIIRAATTQHHHDTTPCSFRLTASQDSPRQEALIAGLPRQQRRRHQPHLEPRGERQDKRCQHHHDGHAHRPAGGARKAQHPEAVVPAPLRRRSGGQGRQQRCDEQPEV